MVSGTHLQEGKVSFRRGHLPGREEREGELDRPLPLEERAGRRRSPPGWAPGGGRGEGGGGVRSQLKQCYSGLMTLFTVITPEYGGFAIRDALTTFLDLEGVPKDVLEYPKF